MEWPCRIIISNEETTFFSFDDQRCPRVQEDVSLGAHQPVARSGRWSGYARLAISNEMTYFSLDDWRCTRVLEHVSLGVHDTHGSLRRESCIARFFISHEKTFSA